MDQKRLQVNGKRLAAGCLLGAGLAIVCPFLTLTQLFASLPLVMLPSIGLVAVYAWAGKAAAIVSAVLQMLAFGYMVGPVFMWVVFLMAIQPMFVLLQGTDRPFFEQLRHALMSFGLGMVLSVLALYWNYGGDLVGSALGGLQQMMHALPVEQMEVYLASYPGMPATSAEFLSMMDSLFAQISSSLAVTLPGQLFSGTLITALSCITLLNRARAKAGAAKPGSYVPPSRWYLPSSTSVGLLVMLLASLVLMQLTQLGRAVFYTVLTLVSWVFCIQALASVSRRMDGALQRHGAKIAVLMVMAAIAAFGASLYLAIYGCASALMGSRGAMRQYAEERKNKDNDGSDDWDE